MTDYIVGPKEVGGVKRESVPKRVTATHWRDDQRSGPIGKNRMEPKRLEASNEREG